MAFVSIITATTGKPSVVQNMLSVDRQTYPRIEHHVVIDGEQRSNAYRSTMIRGYNAISTRYHTHTLTETHLKHPTGLHQYNGHRIYGAFTYLVRGDYVMFLDEDNWLEPNHVEDLVKAVNNDENTWGYSLRKIVGEDGSFICNDDCENLGEYKSCIGDNFVDVNCFFFPKKLALNLTPYWYRRARHPEDQPEVDRLFSGMLFQSGLTAKSSKQYSVNYRVGSRADSVQAQFFLQGNEYMKQKYKGEYPWV